MEPRLARRNGLSQAGRLPRPVCQEGRLADRLLSTHLRGTGIAESARHYLTPLVLVPYGCSTYRGIS
jgi:hypothetical protein